VLLHLLNLVGGYWLFYALQEQTKRQLSLELDTDSYSGSQAILIKLPLTQPVSGNENYERVDGEFEHEGIVYRLVKQKFYKDTAYIVCYKDEKTIALTNVIEDYVNSFTDNAAEKGSDSKSAVATMIKDYLINNDTAFMVRRTAADVGASTGYLNNYFHFCEFAVDHPPELIG